MAKNKKSKNLHSYVMLAIIIGFGVLYWIKYDNYIGSVEPKLFFGTVSSIDNGIISVTGFSHSAGGSKRESIIIEVITGPSTKIIRESGDYKLRVKSGSDQLPSREDITREREEVSFTQFREDVKLQFVSVKIISSENIYRRDKIIASEIYYNTDGKFYNE